MGYGGILNQSTNLLTASDVLYDNSNTSSLITGNNVQEAVDELFTSVSNGKSVIASAITDKGVTTSSDASFSQMATNIRNIKTTPNISYRDYEGASVTIPNGYILWQNCFPVLTFIGMSAGGYAGDVSGNITWTLTGTQLSCSFPQDFYTINVYLLRFRVYFIN